jgi:hypothetical protein
MKYAIFIVVFAHRPDFVGRANNDVGLAFLKQQDLVDVESVMRVESIEACRQTCVNGYNLVHRP